MKFVLSIVVVVTFAVLASAQVAAPPVVVNAQRMVKRGDVMNFGNVEIIANGVRIRADEDETINGGRQFTLTGNARVTLPPRRSRSR